MRKGPGVTQRTASILIEADEAAHAALSALQTAYSNACNLLVPIVVETRCWNRYNLHNLAYRRLRNETPLGAQMCCNALRTVTAAYKAMRSNGTIKKDEPVPTITFRGTSVHFDSRTFARRENELSLYTLAGRVVVALKPGKHQLRLLDWGRPKEAELVFRRGKLFFNLVLENKIELRTTGPVLGLDVGENNLAAVNTGKIWGGGNLRHIRDKHLALRRRTQSNGSESAKQLLRKVSGKERRHMRHVNHVTSKEIVVEALRVGARAIAMEDLTNIRSRIKAGKRVRSRLHRWAFRQLQGFVAYKAGEFGIATIFVDPAYTSETCSGCGEIGLRAKHRFDCKCGRRAHSDVNAALNLARLGESALSPRADVNRPNVAEIGHPSLGQ
jgi:IS605 OrfB family transposase